jgi:hypothetical protein
LSLILSLYRKIWRRIGANAFSSCGCSFASAPQSYDFVSPVHRQLFTIIFGEWKFFENTLLTTL